MRIRSGIPACIRNKTTGVALELHIVSHEHDLGSPEEQREGEGLTEIEVEDIGTEIP
jgi:hypothetical protein